MYRLKTHGDVEGGFHRPPSINSFDDDGNPIRHCFICATWLPLGNFAKSQNGCRACRSKRYPAPKKLGRVCATCEKPITDRAAGVLCQPCSVRALRGVPKKTGRIVGAGGYIVLTVFHDHPNANARGHILEHRLVMAEHLGRPLVESENVHHVNGDRADNRIENLELWSTSQPSGQRVADKVAWARELLALYGDDF